MGLGLAARDESGFPDDETPRVRSRGAETLSNRHRAACCALTPQLVASPVNYLIYGSYKGFGLFGNSVARVAPMVPLLLWSSSSRPPGFGLAPTGREQETTAGPGKTTAQPFATQLLVHAPRADASPRTRTLERHQVRATQASPFVRGSDSRHVACEKRRLASGKRDFSASSGGLAAISGRFLAGIGGGTATPLFVG